MKRVVLWCLLSVGLFGCTSPRSITIDDLQPENAQVIGRLGVPLGATVQIQGDCFDGSELQQKRFDGVTLIRVTHVAGCRLDEPVVLEFRELIGERKRRPGTRFSGFAYETGRYSGIPQKALDLHGPVSTWGFGFDSYLILIDSRE